ncbi:hypothetical protein [Roseovarius sp. D0-M9]|uniref:hypothetical protein n=1 Tax=Roseovarius sp. D0-M9 TaxID=3127117 RepID=UPI0030104A28
MSDLPNPSNGYVATIDYPLSLANLNAILGGMWQALQPYRDVIAEADAAINGLNARTLTVIGESITPELDAIRADVAAAQLEVDALLGNDFEARLDTLETGVAVLEVKVNTNHDARAFFMAQL